MISRIVKNGLKFIIISLLFVSMVFIVSYMQDINIKTIKYRYIKEKQKEISNDETCAIFNCTKLKVKDNILFYDKGSLLYTKHYDNIVKDISIYDNLYYNPFYSQVYVRLNSEKNVYISLKKDLDKLISLMLIFLPLSVAGFIFFNRQIIIEEMEMNMIHLAGHEAISANKTMIMITENIHHELNTPLDVIDNKIEKIHRIVDKYIEQLPKDNRREIDKKIINMRDDFIFIKNSSEQIYTILDKMKGFKNLKYSNGNKSIEDIIEGVFKIISINHSNFEHSIEGDFLKYSIDSNNFKNADLLNILINHIKNSLEANASNIIISCGEFNNNKLSIRIIDNGQGIPKEACKKIFDANFSTKDESENTRGNGMYINKSILNASGGDVKLIETSQYGTTIELNIPVKLRNSQDN